MQLLCVYCAVTVGYREFTVRLLCSYCSYCEITVRLLYGYSDITVRLLYVTVRLMCSTERRESSPRLATVRVQKATNTIV